MKTWTVAQLRAALLELSPEHDDLEICLRVSDGEEAETMVGGLIGAAIDPGCTEINVLMMDADTHAESDHLEKMEEL